MLQTCLIVGRFALLYLPEYKFLLTIIRSRAIEILKHHNDVV